MKVTPLPEVEPRAGGRRVAVGMFDGVHVGHRKVIAGSDTVLTFDPHPVSVVAPQAAPKLLTTLERRAQLMESLGVEELVVIPFDREFASRSAQSFIDDVLVGGLGATHVAVGENFRFGRHASGDVGTLASLGFDVRVVPIVEGISSTRIRQLLTAGEVEGAARLLGRPPEVEGVVVLGDQRGGTLGYPTANLDVPADVLVPAYGIYAGAALGHRAAISIGVNPHYGGTERRIEPYLLEYEGDLYGRRLVVELWERLRDERAFPSEEALVEQIARDVEQTRAAGRPS